ncbi:unnamed protein product, partial [Rotaria socialis]
MPSSIPCSRCRREEAYSDSSTHK